METLHTILLGPYKYLLKTLIPRLTSIQKKQVLARMSTFNYSGFKGKVIGNLIHYLTISYLLDETIKLGHRWHCL